mmetsp:Transcript_10706/g.22999  ORF Transcript_10706/g.22999 Transcript_10706/m.22999 type:complete len:575 (-) Transcript_10706:230-1954(-)
MANDANDLFGDSSSDADTDDLIAAAKSQPIARKKDGGGAAKKKGTDKKTPDADADNNDDDDSDFEDGKKDGKAAAGLFDSSSEDESQSSSPKKKKLGKKRGAAKKKKAAAAKKPAKKDTRSKKERLAALAKRRAAGGEGEDDAGADGEPRKKRSKRKDGGKDGEDKGYASGDSYESVEIQRTKADDDFIDADDEDPDAIKELYAEQHFDDERPDGYDTEEEAKMKKKAASSGPKKSAGGGLDKISLSDDEGGEAASASNALKAAVRRMQRKKKETKKLPELEEEAMAFLKTMEEAADADDTSIANKRPAMKRLAMLPKVMEMLAKKDMTRVLLDLDLLTVCKRWVQPLPNGSLGNVTLRRRIIEAISHMSGENGVSAHDLKKSGFGKVVMTLYMHKNETPEMKKLLKAIIEQWSRPIFQKSGNMKDLALAQAARGRAETGSLVGLSRAQQYEERRRSGGGTGVNPAVRMKTADDLEHIIAKGAKKETNEIGNNRVRVPYSKGFQYSIRPENRTGDVSDKRNLVSAKAAAGTGGGGFRDSEKRDALSKRMLEKNKKTNKQSQRSANISIEGRAVK